MKKYYTGIIFIFVFLIGIIAGHIVQPQGQSLVLAEEGLSMIAQGQDYQNIMKDNISVGEYIKELYQLDLKQSNISNDLDKSIFINFSSINGTDIDEFFPLFKDWSTTFEKELEVIIVYPEKPSLEKRRELESKGVQVIVASDYLIDFYKKYYGKYESLLFEQDGTPRYGIFDMRLVKWQNIYQIVEKFISEEEIKIEETSILEIGQHLILPAIKDVEDNWINPTSFRGKPSLIFLTDIRYKYNSQLYPIIDKINENYNRQLNLNLIFYDYQKVAARERNNYYREYFLPRMKVDTVDINKALNKVEILNIPIIYDQTNQLFNYYQFNNGPTVIICNDNLEVLDFISLNKGTVEGKTSGAGVGISNAIDELLN